MTLTLQSAWVFNPFKEFEKIIMHIYQFLSKNGFFLELISPAQIPPVRGGAAAEQTLDNLMNSVFVINNQNMPTLKDNTPIIIGVGQIKEEMPEEVLKASSHADLAGKAAVIALQDVKNLELASEIDVIAAVKIFSDSSPAHQAKTGRSNNFPRSIAKRIKATPKRAIYDAIGGDSPQRLVDEFAEKLAKGNCEMVLIAGGEAIANTKVAKKKKVPLGWSEKIEGQLEDRGISSGRLGTSTEWQKQKS